MKYHLNEMSKEEMVQFQNDLSTNPDLQASFDDFKISQELVQEARLASVKAKLSTVMKEPLPKNNLGKIRKYGVIGGITVLLLVTLLIYFNSAEQIDDSNNLTPENSEVTISETTSTDQKEVDSPTQAPESCSDNTITIAMSSAASCDELPSGKIYVENIIGGKEPYSIQVEGKNYRGSSLNNLQAGSYSVTVTDHEGCQKTENIVINKKTCTDQTQKNAITASDPIELEVVEETKEEAPDNNKLEITRSPGSTKPMDFPDLCEGKAFTMTSNTKASCEDDENGMLMINEVQGGEAPYSIALNDEKNYRKLFNSSYVRKNLGAGTYKVLIKDDAGCIQATQSITIDAKECKDFGGTIVRSAGQFWTVPEGVNGQLKIVSMTGGGIVYQLNVEDGIEYEWQGVDNNGTELPNGEYYFILNTSDNENITGYISIVN